MKTPPPLPRYRLISTGKNRDETLRHSVERSDNGKIEQISDGQLKKLQATKRLDE